MCVGGMASAKVPTTPERQTVKLPTDSVRDRTADDERRRRGMMATILTSAAGVPGPAMATTTAGKEKLG